MARVSYGVEPYDPCPCGSGKKFKFCCASKVGSSKYPIGTVAYFGPDDQITTKVVAGVITKEGAEPILEKFFGENVAADPAVREKIQAFFRTHFVKKSITTTGNIGCPHEEGVDYAMGEDCPFCPFWKGMQGTGAEE